MIKKKIILCGRFVRRGMVALVCGLCMLLPTVVSAQTDITASFTDANFKAAVYEKIGKTAPAPILDTDVNGIIELEVGYKNISSLAGIQYFTALRNLACNFNQLVNLDVSGLTNLQELDCGDNQLTALDLTGTGLTTGSLVYCSYNNMTSTANVTGWLGGGNWTFAPQNVATSSLEIYMDRNTNGIINLDDAPAVTSWGFNVEGRSITLGVLSNVSWTVSSSASWLTVSYGEEAATTWVPPGDHNGLITLTAAANTTGSLRTATVSVTGDGVTRTVAVTQAIDLSELLEQLNAAWLQIDNGYATLNARQTITPASPVLYDFWQKSYNLIMFCNERLAYSLPDGERQEIISNRALIYFYLKTLFGGVPLATDVSSPFPNPNSCLWRASEEELSEFIRASFNTSKTDLALFEMQAGNWAAANSLYADIFPTPTVSDINGDGIVNEVDKHYWIPKLLLAAEASLRTGDATQAIGYVNVACASRGMELPSLSTATSDEILAVIKTTYAGYDEGLKFRNASRWGETQTWGYRNLMPVPQQLLEENPCLQQNPGWEWDNDVTPALTLSASTLNVAAAGSPSSVTVTSNIGWTASSDATWLTVSPASGIGNGTLTLTAATNTANSIRTATVTVNGSGITRTVTVTQAAASPLIPQPIITLSTSEMSMATPGGSGTVGITSNVNWTASSNAPWLTITPAAGTNNGTLALTVTANTATTPRTAIVSVRGSGLTRTVTVTQEAAKQVIVDPELPANGSGTIEVSLNVPVNESFSATFTLQLPTGFLLDQQATALVSELLSSYWLIITPTEGGGWRFEIIPQTALRNGDETVYQKVVNIVYTIAPESVPAGDYAVKLTDVNLQMNSGETVHQDEITVPIHVTSTGNATVDATAVTYANGLLTVNTAQAEQINVYALSGARIFSAQKDAGRMTFDLSRLAKGVYIVTGNAWTRKIIDNK